MRQFLLSITLIYISTNLVAADNVLKIAFSSCYEQDKHNLEIWQSIQTKQPDLFIFLGDNAYIDSEDPDKFAQDYKALFANPGIDALRQSTDIMATWDDHDYGLNDGGKEFTAKEIAKSAFITAFNYPELHSLSEKQGIYHSRILSIGDKKVRIIMLDTRWYRDALNSNPLNEADREKFELGRYRPHTDTSKTLLGNEQWQWLDETLSIPVDLNVIATSIQFISEYTAWEIWANFPHERQRMLELLNSKAPGKAVFISGDVHRAETSAMPIGDWQLFDITTGPLSAKTYPGKPNIHRIGGVYSEFNFGMLTITADTEQLQLNASIYNNQGEILEQHTIPLSLLED